MVLVNSTTKILTRWLVLIVKKIFESINNDERVLIIKNRLFPKVTSLISKLESDALKTLGNDGERLIPGHSNDSKELIRHRSTYSLFRHIIEADIRRNPLLIENGIRILDLGSGVGHGTRLLSEIVGVSVVGVEIDASSVEYAKQNYNSSNIEYINQSIEKYLENCEVFDYVVTRHALEHIHQSIDIIKPKKHFRRRAMISVPYREAKGNPFHVHTMITTDDFDSYELKEFVYEDLEGASGDEEFSDRFTNSITCVVTASVDLGMIKKILNFPIPPVELGPIEKEYFLIIEPAIK